MKSLLLCGLALAALPALVAAMVPWTEQAREIRSWTGDSQARWRARLDRVLEARMARTDHNPVELPAAGPVTPLAPGWNSSLATFSGLLPLSSAPGSALFFWLFQPAAPVNASAAPTVLFLNGGPGSSSGLGLFFESGPYRINANLTLSPNPFHWAQQYNLVFLDQPVGVGLSHLANASHLALNASMYATHAHEALVQFFALFPVLASNDFYITGESYAGHYIPAIASYILAQNEAGVSPRIPLRGIAIGNGWNDPILHALHCPMSGLQTGTLDLGLFGLATDFATAANATFASGDALVAFAEAGLAFGTMLVDSGVCMYNSDHASADCYATDVMEAFLNQPAVLAKLHVANGTVFHTDSEAVWWGLLNDEMLAQQHWYTDLLDRFKIRVLLYQGLLDPTFVRSGQEAFAWSLPWSGAAAFQATLRQQWVASGDADGLSGYVRSSEPLTWAEVRGAGHLVPADQGLRALDMITRWIERKWD